MDSLKTFSLYQEITCLFPERWQGVIEHLARVVLALRHIRHSHSDTDHIPMLPDAAHPLSEARAIESARIVLICVCLVLAIRRRSNLGPLDIAGVLHTAWPRDEEAVWRDQLGRDGLD